MVKFLQVLHDEFDTGLKLDLQIISLLAFAQLQAILLVYG